MNNLDLVNAPEGTTHYSNYLNFYIMKDMTEMIWSNGCWVNCSLSDDLLGALNKIPPKPVFTQKMSDNGILPLVGMECLYKRHHEADDNFDWCFIVGKSKDKKWLIFHDERNDSFSEHVDSGVYIFKPLTPPIELFNGRYYGFNYKEGLWCGIYNKDDDKFYFTSSFIVAKHCTNITLLTPETNS